MREFYRVTIGALVGAAVGTMLVLFAGVPATNWLHGMFDNPDIGLIVCILAWFFVGGAVVAAATIATGALVYFMLPRKRTLFDSLRDQRLRRHG